MLTHAVPDNAFTLTSPIPLGDLSVQLHIHTHVHTHVHTHKLTCTHNHKSAQPSQGNITISSDHTTHLVHTRMPYVRSLSDHDVKFRFTAGRLETCGTLYFTDTCNSMSTPYPVMQIKLKKHLKTSSNKTISRQKELPAVWQRHGLTHLQLRFELYR